MKPYQVEPREVSFQNRPRIYSTQCTSSPFGEIAKEIYDVLKLLDVFCYIYVIIYGTSRSVAVNIFAELFR